MEETLLYPGVFTKTSRRGATTIESICRKVLRDNGYPTSSCMDTPCTQPDLCLKIADCTPGGGGISEVCALNGLSGVGLEGNCVQLGGSLIQATTVDTATFDLAFAKDNVRLDINDNGGTLGAGETARFLATSGTITAEVGTYTNGGGTPVVGARVANTANNFFALELFDTVLNRYVINAGLTTNTYSSTLYLDKDKMQVGLSGTTSTLLVIEKFTFTGGTDIVKLINLPVFADNAAATGAGLTTDCVYKTATGELRIVV